MSRNRARQFLARTKETGRGRILPYGDAELGNPLLGRASCEGVQIGGAEGRRETVHETDERKDRIVRHLDRVRRGLAREAVAAEEQRRARRRIVQRIGRTLRLHLFSIRNFCRQLPHYSKRCPFTNKKGADGSVGCFRGNC